jgi:hypothetical protein
MTTPTASDVRPLVAESSTSESTNVKVVLDDLTGGTLRIPDYQRDADQWDDTTKSLFIESVINNLTIPAFFFEVIVVGGIETNEVVDGQQRLTTLQEFAKNKFRLVEHDDAPYLSPMSVLYAGKTFDEIPAPYQQAFHKYRLSIIKLRGLSDVKLEVFRRINQGGTPLSGQDIRLAYYGDGSPSMALIRVVGIYDPARTYSNRILDALQRHGIAHPWDPEALATWNDYWADKDIARGQTASEMFLWSIVSAQAIALDSLLSNSGALQVLKSRFSGGIDEALDVCCAQMQYQDRFPSESLILYDYQAISGRFFPHFQSWLHRILGREAPSLGVNRYRAIASLIGAAFSVGKSSESITRPQWTAICDFLRNPKARADTLGVTWPLGRGRWDGRSGYREQFKCAANIVKILLK